MVCVGVCGCVCVCVSVRACVRACLRVRLFKLFAFIPLLQLVWYFLVLLVNSEVRLSCL